MKLLVSLPNPYGRKVRIVLAEKRIDCDIEQVDVSGEASPVDAVNPLGKVERGLAQIAADLDQDAWCHNERYTLADIALGCCLGWLEFRHPSIRWREQYANLARHTTKLSARPAFAETAPKT